jgi:hypothetical protein
MNGELTINTGDPERPALPPSLLEEREFYCIQCGRRLPFSAMEVPCRELPSRCGWCADCEARHD